MPPSSALRNPLRLRLGAAIRALRTRASLSGKQLADRAGISQSKISRIESGGLWPPRSDFIAILDSLYVDQAARDTVLNLVDAIESGATTFRDTLPGSLEVTQREHLALENTATAVRVLGVGVLPDVLHTPTYAAAVTAGTNLTGQRDTDAATAARMLRTQQARSPEAAPHHLIITESALRVVPAGCENSMSEVWQTVLDTARQPTITVQVLLISTPTPVPLSAGFVLYELGADRLAIVDTPAGETVFAGDQTAGFDTAWRHLAAAALPPAESLGILLKFAADA